MRFVSRLGSRCLLFAALVAATPSLAEPIPIGGVVRVDGRPAEGVDVLLLPVIARHAAGELRLAGKAHAQPVAVTRSDKAGRFELEAPGIGLWNVRLAGEGWVPKEVELEPLLHATELGEVELDADRGLEVKIRAGGEPAAARVVAFPFDPAFSRMAGARRAAFDPRGGRRPPSSTTADGEGRVRVPGAGDEKGWVVEAAAEGWVPSRLEVSGGRRGLELELRAGVRREIETVDPRGEPVSGAVLFFGDGGRLPLARTDDRGRTFLAVPADGDLELTAIDAMGRLGRLSLSPPGASAAAAAPAVVTITLDEPRTVTGRVVEKSSREPIPGALVWSGSGAAQAATTDAGGFYALRLPASPATRRGQVSAAATGYVIGREATPPTGTEGPTVALEPAARVAGRVFDAEGSGLAGVEIEVTTRITRERRRFTRGLLDEHRGRSDSGGRFEIAGLAAGESYDLRLVKPGFAPAELEVSDLEPFERRAGLEAVLHRGRRAVGLVVDEQDQPIAGAVVRLAEPKDPRRRVFRMPGTEEEPPGGETGADGRFAVAGLAAGRYDLEVEATGFGPVRVPGIEVPEGVGDADLGTVALPAGVAIEGRVVDVDGAPVAGAAVHATEALPRPMPASFQLMTLAGETPAAVSAADGFFAVGDRRPGERLDLLVAGEGYVARTVPGVTAPSEAPIEVVLQRVARVSGRVVDDRGVPIEGARVQARPEGLGGSGARRRSSFLRATTDAEGRFELLDVEPGKVTVAAQAEGFQETRLSGLEAPAGGELSDVELVLRPGATVRGTVVDAGGAPVAGVRVTIEATGGGRREGFALTDGDGRFELSGVGLGRRTVSASDDGRRHASKSLDVEAGGASVELRFAGGVEVSGRVTDPDGLGVAGVEVSLMPASRPGSWINAPPEVASSADGGFVLPGVAPGSYRLSARREGFADTQADEPIEVASSPIEGLEIRLDAGATLTGRILGLELDDLARVEVRAGPRSGRVDFEGNYRIDHLPAWEMAVTASIPGTGRQVSEGIKVERGVTELTLDLEFGGGVVLTGTVVAGEQPVAGVTVRVFGGSVRTSAGATTDAEGRFRIEGLETGSYRLWLRSLESGLEHRQEIELSADDDVVVQVGSSRVAGRVLDRGDSSGVEGARLSLVPADSEGVARAFGKSSISDSLGAFSFAAVPEGSYALRASKPGYADVETAVSVGPGQVQTGIEVFLNPAAGLSFEVVTATGAPPSRVQAVLLDGAGARVAGGSYPTLEGGRVELTTAPAGSWEMLLVTGDSGTLSLQVVVPGDAGRIQLPPGGVAVVTVPDLEGDPVQAELELSGPDGRPYRSLLWGGAVVSRFPLLSGSVTVKNLTVGAWTFHVSAADGRSWSASAVVVPGQPLPVTLE